MQDFPLIEAYWASINRERPSGDDPKQVAFALHSFYRDLQKHSALARQTRWKTQLFLELEPQIDRDIDELLHLCPVLAQAGNSPLEADLSKLKKLDRSLRQAIYQMQVEEQNCGLTVHPSPKLNQFNYLFEGWKRKVLGSEKVLQFAREYAQAVKATQGELAQTKDRVNPRESAQESEAVELAISTVNSLDQQLQAFVASVPRGAAHCETVMSDILKLGEQLGRAFQNLEQCAPVSEPCPFCGGELSLNGRCKACGKQLPRLETLPEQGERSLQSEFMSLNSRAVDLALLKWEAEPKNLDLWQAFRKAVRVFAAQVAAGGKSVEMLAMSNDRPIDRDSELRVQEESLKKVAQAYREASSTLSKFSQSPKPAQQTLPSSWRESLLQAERELQIVEDALAEKPQ